MSKKHSAIQMCSIQTKASKSRKHSCTFRSYQLQLDVGLIHHEVHGEQIQIPSLFRYVPQAIRILFILWTFSYTGEGLCN